MKKPCTGARGAWAAGICRSSRQKSMNKLIAKLHPNIAFASSHCYTSGMKNFLSLVGICIVTGLSFQPISFAGDESTIYKRDTYGNEYKAGTIRSNTVYRRGLDGKQYQVGTVRNGTIYSRGLDGKQYQVGTIQNGTIYRRGLDGKKYVSGRIRK